MVALAVVAVGVAVLAWIGGRHAVANWGSPVLNRLDGLNRFFCQRFHRLSSQPISLPESGGVVLVSNHVSGLDPVALLAASPRPLHWLIATEEYDRWYLRWLFLAVGCIPVDRGGRPEKAMRRAIRSLEDGHVVAVFPEGGIHTSDARGVKLKRGAVFMADSAGVPVVPVRIEGVKGEGRTMLAVVERSHLVVHVGEILGPELDADTRMAEIEAFIRP